ncbi:MAG: hypothetical protein IKI95_07005 [Clostridia bacterium]|nr:hypothetical protein [Clostridia bacterium]
MTKKSKLQYFKKKLRKTKQFLLIYNLTAEEKELVDKEIKYIENEIQILKGKK